MAKDEKLRDMNAGANRVSREPFLVGLECAKKAGARMLLLGATPGAFLVMHRSALNLLVVQLEPKS